MRQRDEALRSLADSLSADRPTGAMIREMHILSKRYAASAWRIDRNYEDMPAAYAGTPKEFLWQAFQSGAPMPLGERQLRNIVA